MWTQKSFAPGATGQSGSLYLVATPVGNLDDMTFRAVETLKKADLIAAEDTRQTRKLLAHFDIHTRVVSYHEHNKHASGSELIRLLHEGKNIALVSDAGTPAVSDPGMELVAHAVEEQIHVIPIPGANAAITALIASGMSTTSFLFAGFLPRDQKAMALELQRLSRLPDTIIFYESPHRILKTLEYIKEYLGNRSMAIGRELTKIHEEFLRGTVEELLPFLKNLSQIRGEFCLIVAGNSGENVEDKKEEWWNCLSDFQHVNHYIEQGLSVKEAIRKTAEERKVSRREIYNAYHKQDDR